jgi:hypothetical protein
MFSAYNNINNKFMEVNRLAFRKSVDRTKCNMCGCVDETVFTLSKDCKHAGCSKCLNRFVSDSKAIAYHTNEPIQCPVCDIVIKHKIIFETDFKTAISKANRINNSIQICHGYTRYFLSNFENNLRYIDRHFRLTPPTEPDFEEMIACYVRYAKYYMSRVLQSLRSLDIANMTDQYIPPTLSNRQAERLKKAWHKNKQFFEIYIKPLRKDIVDVIDKYNSFPFTNMSDLIDDVCV